MDGSSRSRIRLGRCGRGGGAYNTLNCPLIVVVGDHAGVRSTEFGGVLSSEVSNVLV